jgi:hypothetical protein
MEDQIGRTSYERRRALAMMLLMRYAGLRISDVVTLSRDHIRGVRLESARRNPWGRSSDPRGQLVHPLQMEADDGAEQAGRL